MKSVLPDKRLSKKRLVQSFNILLLIVAIAESALPPVPVEAQGGLVLEVKVTDQRTGLPLANASSKRQI